MPLYQARGAGSGGRQANAQDAGGGVGQVQIAEGLSNLNQVGFRITDAVYTTRAARGLARAAGRLDEQVAVLDAAADSDPAIDHSRYSEEYERRLAEIRDEEGEDLPAQYRDVYDEKLGLYGDRARLGLSALIQKKQLAQGKAYLTETLRSWATEEARARTPLEKAAVRKNTSELLGRVRALGMLDDKELFGFTHAYEEEVWSAALNEGLAGDPTLLKIRLETRDGVFSDMPEDKREAGILAATRREEAVVRDAEIKLRFGAAEDRRKEAEQARSAASWALNKAVSADPNERLTPEDLALAAPSLEKSPALLAQLGRVVESGGRFPPGPPDKDYYGKLMQLWGDDPAAFASLPYGPNEGPGIDHLDPKLLGSQWQQTFEAQRKVEAAGPAQVGSNEDIALARWNRIEQKLSDVPFFSWLPYGAQSADELDSARADYYLRVQSAQRAYKQEHKRDADGTEFTKLLDGVVLDLAEKYGDERLRALRDVSPENTPELAVPRGTGALLGISPENVELMRRSLTELGLPADDAAIRRAYDDALGAGRISP